MNKDLISRQDAIEEVSKYVHSVDMIIGNGTLSMAGCRDTAEEILEELPSIESEPKWILCSERLPEEGCHVVMCGVDGAISIGRMGTNLFWVGTKVTTAVAWIPLPNAYEGGYSK